jgi:hypothetical protein
MVQDSKNEKVYILLPVPSRSVQLIWKRVYSSQEEFILVLFQESFLAGWNFKKRKKITHNNNKECSTFTNLHRFAPKQKQNNKRTNQKKLDSSTTLLP